MINDKKTASKILLLALGLIFIPADGGMGFGFFAHRTINYMAVFCMPPQMIGFFKKNAEYLSDHSIDADRRSYVLEGEAARHYIDIEDYGPRLLSLMPAGWKIIAENFSKDTLNEHGVLPWHIVEMLERLTRAFKKGDKQLILYNAANLGHYVADACTPLHTSSFYNGRLNKEKGIHALWETRIPELLASELFLLPGRAEYIENPQAYVWQLVRSSHQKVDSIYYAFNNVINQMPANCIYSLQKKPGNNKIVFSETFSLAFNNLMNNMVERQMQKAIKSVADFWYTAWVNAGQPNLETLKSVKRNRKQKRKFKKEQKMLEKTGKRFNNLNEDARIYD